MRMFSKMLAAMAPAAVVQAAILLAAVVLLGKPAPGLAQDAGAQTPAPPTGQGADGAGPTAKAPSKAPALDEGLVTEIHLITMGPGDHPFTRFGHTALMVYQHRPGTKQYRSLIYNYGDADFQAAGFEWRFFRGTAQFFISTLGTLNETVTRYARENRTITHQRLALSPEQTRKVAAFLEEAMRPENRQYRYHHLRAGCATKVRDLLDQILGGAIKARFAQAPAAQTPRLYGRQVFAGHLGLEVFADLFMGRLHDAKWSKYEAMCIPALLRGYLQEVMVPNPDGDGLVALAPPPRELFRRRGPPPTVGEGRTLIHLSYLWIVLLCGLGVYVLVGQPAASRRASVWLTLWALPMGLASLCMLAGAVLSTVIEGRVNELMLSWPLTDLLLLGIARRWWRGENTAGPLLRRYAWVRAGLVVLALLLHLVGVFYQEPRVLLVVSLAASALLLVVVHRFPSPPLVPQTLREPRP